MRREYLLNRLRGQARRVLRDMGVPYREVREIPDLGSSPGDIMWTGQTLVMEEYCPSWWIVHEVGHYIEAVLTGNVRCRNWGFERKDEDSDGTREEAACGWSMVLMHALGYPKWLIEDVSSDTNTFYRGGWRLEREGFQRDDYEAWVREHAAQIKRVPNAPRELVAYLTPYMG